MMVIDPKRDPGVPKQFIYGGIFLGVLIVMFCYTLVTGLKPADGKRIRINEMVELDFKTKQQVCDLRMRAVMQNADLLEGPYQPSEAVFGALEDGKPWWGTMGHAYYGDGRRSIEGLSIQSRHIVNPFVLVGLQPYLAHRIHHQLPFKPVVYPKPVRLEWNKAAKRATVLYEISTFFAYSKAFIGTVDDNILVMVAYNARDLGYKYFYLDEMRSRNVHSFNTTGEPLEIPFLLHVGQSCGYPGGCNNVSPNAPYFTIRIQGLPATAYIKLWREQPDAREQRPDMEYIIEMR